MRQFDKSGDILGGLAKTGRVWARGVESGRWSVEKTWKAKELSGLIEEQVTLEDTAKNYYLKAGIIKLSSSILGGVDKENTIFSKKETMANFQKAGALFEKAQEMIDRNMKTLDKSSMEFAFLNEEEKAHENIGKKGDLAVDKVLGGMYQIFHQLVGDKLLKTDSGKNKEDLKAIAIVVINHYVTWSFSTCSRRSLACVFYETFKKCDYKTNVTFSLITTTAV